MFLIFYVLISIFSQQLPISISSPYLSLSLFQTSDSQIELPV